MEDILLKHLLKHTTIHTLSFKLPLKSYHRPVLDESRLYPNCLQEAFDKLLQHTFREIATINQNLTWLIGHYLLNKNLLSWDNSWYSLQMPSGSSWRAVPAYSKMRYNVLPPFQATFQSLTYTHVGWNNENMSKSKTSFRCPKEAVDKLLQHTWHDRIKKTYWDHLII